MGRYGIAPYMRGGGTRVRVRVRRWTCGCIMETGAGRMDRLPTTPAACGYDA